MLKGLLLLLSSWLAGSVKLTGQSWVAVPPDEEAPAVAPETWWSLWVCWGRLGVGWAEGCDDGKAWLRCCGTCSQLVFLCRRWKPVVLRGVISPAAPSRLNSTGNEVFRVRAVYCWRW